MLSMRSDKKLYMAPFASKTTTVLVPQPNPAPWIGFAPPLPGKGRFLSGGGNFSET
jgi:hypothetical protein